MIRVRKAKIERLMRQNGMTSRRHLAEAMGLAESTISRQLNGSAPSPEFLEGCKRLWPGLTLDELFESVSNEARDEPAAA